MTDFCSAGELEEHYKGVVSRLGMMTTQPVVYMPSAAEDLVEKKKLLRIERCRRWLARNRPWRSRMMKRWYQRKDLIGSGQKVHYSPYREKVEKRKILLKVCARNEVTVAEVRSSSRRAALVAARLEIVGGIVAAYPLTGISALGRIINRDHTTAWYLLGKLGLRRPKIRSTRRH